MTFPQFMSPSYDRSVIIEFSDYTKGRIILSTSRNIHISNRCGSTASIGTYSTRWVQVDDSTSWSPACPELLASIPYIQYHYPELFI